VLGAWRQHPAQIRTAESAELELQALRFAACVRRSSTGSICERKVSTSSLPLSGRRHSQPLLGRRPQPMRPGAWGPWPRPRRPPPGPPSSRLCGKGWGGAEHRSFLAESHPAQSELTITGSGRRCEGPRGGLKPEQAAKTTPWTGSTSLRGFSPGYAFGEAFIFAAWRRPGGSTQSVEQRLK